MTKISMIVAIAKLQAIGQNNDLLAYIPKDLKRFKALTTGHTIIMGRKTFDSLPNGALPNRRNIVISRNEALKIEGAEVVHSPEAAIELCKNDEEAFVIGGATVYEAFLPKANKLYLTLIDQFFNDADTFFPEFDESEWKETYREEVADDHQNDFSYTFLDLERK
ncbi:dihydrofolate reductase [Saccharicrinis fermentans]|uniref:Dihydrofolate reductase n=1 Tax=Saccharicrinis fermentans DSM 9555 = JCM 21142 TaxID=869213 RepID=W7XW16_9BACT|nr:dihydrofolate reductase [Saccharicrinis fermentans]GAF02460.1 dihydrofolate reductase [Saccharicrinis fermentans DSM 9555 = JCM 21142]